MTEEYPSFDEAEEGEYVDDNTIKAGEHSFKCHINRSRMHSEKDNRMIEHLHRTAESYGLDHSQAAEIYNEIDGFLADTHRLDEDQFEEDIENALTTYSNGVTAAEVVEEYGLEEPPLL